MALARFSLIRRFNGASQRLLLPSISRCSPSYMNSGTEEFGRRSIMTSSCDISGILGWNSRDSIMLCSMKVSDLTVYSNGTRPMSTMKAPAGARQVALKVTMLSPGFVYEPYKLREPIPFWKRWFTPSGWRRTKEDIILEMKNAYAISRLRKVTGYSKKLFYQHAIRLYKEINTLISDGDTSSLRKVVTEKMYSTLKNELKRRESIWSFVYWELVEPVVSIRTLRARMIALDKNDLDKAFIQLTIEFVTKQKFEAYDSKGAVVSGDKTKEVLVKDIWVFERSLFHPGADWRLCARLSV
ncbi:39S ribosomal protein L45, mitochondrial isoform X1 [Phoenix dactylifera]|uniref:Large ribosomal subunit protein mL45 n=1 Tax=Phoenix dactylifera TaxID=42345 RepID=A0A8B9ANG0_PHODC|nr:39S ribosomal protein L45, mitochondrial isoform X1 [Phoenix dactylifera]